MSTDMIQIPIKGYAVHFDYEGDLSPAITPKERVSLARAYQLILDRPEDLGKVVAQSHPGLTQNCVMFCSLSAQKGPKHWGTLIEVEYRIIGKATWSRGRYRQVFHFMMDQNGLCGRLFTQTSRYIPG